MTLSSEMAELGARNALVTLCEVSRHYEPDTHPNIKNLIESLSQPHQKVHLLQVVTCFRLSRMLKTGMRI